MDNLRTDSTVARYLATGSAFKQFTVVDVGCSGGIDAGWRVFGEKLRAVGFDPSLNEIRRLNDGETNPNVQYFAGFVGLEDGHPLKMLSEKLSHFRRNPWISLSAYVSTEVQAGRAPTIPGPVRDVRAIEGEEAELLRAVEAELTKPIGNGNSGGLSAVSQTDVQLDVAAETELMSKNLWQENTLADRQRTIVLPELLSELSIGDIDFLKIDIDGPDYDVLYSCRELLNPLSVLGATLEVNFIGSDAPHHHTFHNTDRFMRAQGFELFGLTVRHYSSSALPAPYVLPYPAQTRTGRPIQGDALYVRDFGVRSSTCDADHFSDEKLAKTIAVFSLFGLPDQAAELALRFRQRLSAKMDLDELLDLLAKEAQPGRAEPRSYGEYMQEFRDEAPWFFGG